MNCFKGALRNNLRERPFDFYTAFVIFLAGMFALVSPYWPENAPSQQITVMINLVSIYMMVASAIVMSALLCNRKTKPVYAVLGEMWGWLAISAASFAVTIMYIAQMIYVGYPGIWLSIILALIWFGMFIASGFRSLDIYLMLRRNANNG
jgi:hypothetical protein